MTGPITLRTVLANTKLATPIREGLVACPQVRLDFIDVKPVHDAFTPMIRSQAYDLCELAIVSCLQAVEYNRPIVMLPVVVASRFQRGCIIASRSRGVPLGSELAGKRVGVRAYTQTTGMWVRAHLAEDYGLATPSIHWVTRQPAHAEEYRDPPFVEPIGRDKSLADMLRDGDIVAAIFGNDLPKGDEFVPVIPDASAKDLAWWKQHGFMPINHMMVAGRDVSRNNPGAVREAYHLLSRAHALNDAPPGAPSPIMLGFEALREPVRWIVEACVEQGLLSRRLSVDEIFGPAAELLEGSRA